MKILQITRFYETYLADFYRRHPDFAQQPFGEQMTTLYGDGFSAGHIISPYMADLGYQPDFLVANCYPAQRNWCREVGIAWNDRDPDFWLALLLEQIRIYAPDVLYVQGAGYFDSAILRLLNPRPPLIIGWSGVLVPETMDFSAYDVVVSNFDLCLTQATRLKARNVAQFAPGVPEFLATAVADQPVCHDVVFTGQISPDHTQRLETLKHLGKLPLQWERELDVGYYIQFIPELPLPPGQHDPRFPMALNLYNHPSRWGIEMYKTLRAGHICLNHGIDFAGQPGNMRMFETTGVGGFLLTNTQPGIARYFEPGKEVETYGSPGELEEKIRYYLDHPEARAAVAQAGHERCLREYGMPVRAQALDAIIRRYLP